MILHYVCPRCGNSIKKIQRNITLKEVSKILPCLDCGGFLELFDNPENLTSSSLEEVDYGNTDRSVTWRKDISQRMKERQDAYLQEMESRERPYANRFDEKE